MSIDQHRKSKNVILELLVDKGLTKEFRRITCKPSKIDSIKYKHDKIASRVIGSQVVSNIFKEKEHINNC